MQSSLQKTVIEQLFQQQSNETCLEQQMFFRIPIVLYKMAHEYLKKIQKVNQILIEILIKQMYIEDPILYLSQNVKEQRKVLRDLRNKFKDKGIFINQIILRIVILALAVKLSMVNDYYKTISLNLKEAIQGLQLQMVLSPSSNFTSTIIKQLEFMTNQFGCLQFYQQLRKLFMPLGLNLINKWIENSILKIKKSFNQSVKENTSALKQKKSNLKTARKRITINIPSKDVSNCKQKQKQEKQDQQIKQKTKIKFQSQPHPDSIQEHFQQPKNKRQNSIITQANKLRQSVSPKPAFLNIKYTFKSCKKDKMTQVIQKQQTTYVYQSPPLKKIVTKKITKNTSRISLNDQYWLDEDCKILCEGTPVRIIEKP